MLLNPTADTFISPGVPNTGGDGYLLVGGYRFAGNGIRNRTLMRFDLSSLPPMTFARARLTCQIIGGTLPVGNSTFTLAKLTTTAWVELAATWFDYDVAHNWTTAGGDFGPAAATAIVTSASQKLIFDFPILANEMLGGLLNVELYGVEAELFDRYVQLASRSHANATFWPTLELASARGCVAIADRSITNLAIAQTGCL